MTPKQLAKEFRRLAAEAEKKREYYQFDRQAHAGFAVERNTWNRAAQMLEEKLQPGYELKVEGEGMNATVEYVDEDPLRWLP